MRAEPRVIVALDFASSAAALALAAQLDPRACRVKVGKELFTAAGPRVVERLVEHGFDVFLDLKFHDIPHTVAQACWAAAKLGVWMLDVHALGGRAMLQAAREAVEGAARRPKLVAVTLLTSQGPEELSELGIAGTAEEVVERFARLARSAGLDGVVCSAQEAAVLRRSHGGDFLLVTPGIRPHGESRDDQRRVATPRAALSAGASYLVVGRPITRALDPAAALAAINRDIEGANA